MLEREARGVAGATQIADRFVRDRRHAHPRQIAGPKQPGELHGIASIRLHFVAGFLRDQRGCDDVTGEPLARQGAMQRVAARAGLVGKHQRGRLGLKPPDQFLEVRPGDCSMEMDEIARRPFYTDYAWALDLLIDRPVRKESAVVAAWQIDRGITPDAKVLDAG